MATETIHTEARQTTAVEDHWTHSVFSGFNLGDNTHQIGTSRLDKPVKTRIEYYYSTDGYMFMIERVGDRERRIPCQDVSDLREATREMLDLMSALTFQATSLQEETGFTENVWTHRILPYEEPAEGKIALIATSYRMIDDVDHILHYGYNPSEGLFYRMFTVGGEELDWYTLHASSLEDAIAFAKADMLFLDTEVV